jgi:hypothetical protein
VTLTRDGTVSNANAILEPGETVFVEPGWRNDAGGNLTLTGTQPAYGTRRGG